MTSLFHNPPGPRQLSSSPTKQTTTLGNAPRFAPPSSADEQTDEPYRSSFDDDSEPPFTSPRNSDTWQPFSENVIDTQPYEQTILLFHHNRRGVRVYIQARTKIFFALVGVLLVVLNLPGVSNLITALVKAMLGGN